MHARPIGPFVASALSLSLLLWSAAAGAQASPAGVAPDANAASGSPVAACYPACRRGFVCSAGSCVSLCNPPCAQGETCMGDYCEIAPPEVGIREPPPPVPKGFAERSHSGMAFHVGFGGSGEIGSDEGDLATTYGFNIRNDFPLVRYLLVGPLFQFGGWRPDAPGSPTYNYYIDIDLFVRGRLPLELDPVALQFWGGVPIGLTMDFLGNDLARTLDGFGIGWNVGVLFGGALHFTKRFGIFAELGWIQHRANHDNELGRGSTDIALGQTNFNVGFMFDG